MPARIGQFSRISGILRAGLKKLDMKFYIPEKSMSNTMTSVFLSEGNDYPSLYRACKDKGYVIYASQGALAKDTFRLGTVGLISEEDIRGFLVVMGGILKK